MRYGKVTAALAALATLTLSVLAVAPAPTATAEGIPLSLHVAGNQFVDGAGNTVRLVGVDFSGQQYACAEGWGLFDAPATDASVTAMKSWGVTAVRVPLNEECWLGINGVKPAYGGAIYQAAIGAWVAKLNAAGLYVIIDEHHTHNGTGRATGQQPMANRDHADDYWRSVAAYFRDSPAVVFDLFNEPHPARNRDNTAAWTCVRDGGTCPGVGYVAAGMQEMLDAVRSTGATNPVLVAGPQYAGVLDRWLEFEPVDPVGQLAASVHVYGQTLGSPYGDDPSRLDTEVAPLAEQVPVVMGEIGETDCGQSFIDALMPWADAHGVGYLAWGWVTSSCADEPALISDYDGTPTPYGVGFRDHVQALGLS